MMLYTRDCVGSKDLNDLYLAFSTFSPCLRNGSKKMGTYRVMLTWASSSLIFGHFYSCLEESLFHYLQKLLKPFSILWALIKTLPQPTSLSFVKTNDLDSPYVEPSGLTTPFLWHSCFWESVLLFHANPSSFLCVIYSTNTYWVPTKWSSGNAKMKKIQILLLESWNLCTTLALVWHIVNTHKM